MEKMLQDLKKFKLSQWNAANLDKKCGMYIWEVYSHFGKRKIHFFRTLISTAHDNTVCNNINQTVSTNENKAYEKNSFVIRWN